MGGENNGAMAQRHNEDTRGRHQRRKTQAGGVPCIHELAASCE